MRGTGAQTIAMLWLTSSLLSCDGVIGLSDPSVALPDGGDVEADAPDGAELADSDEADDESTPDEGLDSGTGFTTDSGSAPDADVTSPIVDATEADVDATTFDSPVTSAGDAALAFPTKVILLNSMPDLPSVRVCFGVPSGPSIAISSFVPLPDQLGPAQTIPGIDLWSGGALPIGSGGLPDPSLYTITPYLLRADAVLPTVDGGPLDCVELLGADGLGVDGGLTPGVDFWPLPPMPQGTFSERLIHFVLFHGCLPASLDPTASVERCGQDYDGGNDLSWDVYAFLPIAGVPFAARIIQGSRPIDGVFADEAGASVSEIVSLGSLVMPFELTDLIFKGSSVWSPLAGGELANGTGTLNMQVVTDAGSSVATYSWTFDEIAQATMGSAVIADGGDYYTQGQAYTFVLVGDPSAPPDSGAQPHVIVFPDDIPIPGYP